MASTSVFVVAEISRAVAALAPSQHPGIEVSLDKSPQSTLSFADRDGRKVPLSGPSRDRPVIEAAKVLCSFFGSQITP